MAEDCEQISGSEPLCLDRRLQCERGGGSRGRDASGGHKAAATLRGLAERGREPAIPDTAKNQGDVLQRSPGASSPATPPGKEEAPSLSPVRRSTAFCTSAAAEPSRICRSHPGVGRPSGSRPPARRACTLFDSCRRNFKIRRILIDQHLEIEATAGRVRPLCITSVDSYFPGPFRE